MFRRSLALAIPAFASPVLAQEAGFEVATYATGLDEPVAMQFAPDDATLFREGERRIGLR